MKRMEASNSCVPSGPCQGKCGESIQRKRGIMTIRLIVMELGRFMCLDRCSPLPDLAPLLHQCKHGSLRRGEKRRLEEVGSAFLCKESVEKCKSIQGGWVFLLSGLRLRKLKAVETKMGKEILERKDIGLGWGVQTGIWLGRWAVEGL